MVAAHRVPAEDEHGEALRREFTPKAPRAGS
jgi:hypothetical protein